MPLSRIPGLIAIPIREARFMAALARRLGGACRNQLGRRSVPAEVNGEPDDRSASVDADGVTASRAVVRGQRRTRLLPISQTQLTQR